MLTMNEVRKGKAIVLEGEPYVVMTADFLKKQQRRPVVRSRLKHLVTGAAREHTFMQADKIEEAAVERKPYQFLYQTNNFFAFMDEETYEQAELPAEVVGDAVKFLLEGQVLEALLFQGKPVAVELPIKIERGVVTAPPGIKGNTSANVMKEVEVEGGAIVRAPLFVKAGDRIVIDTRTGTYVERA
jgi:elongation factor P